MTPSHSWRSSTDPPTLHCLSSSVVWCSTSSSTTLGWSCDVPSVGVRPDMPAQLHLTKCGCLVRVHPFKNHSGLFSESLRVCMPNQSLGMLPDQLGSVGPDHYPFGLFYGCPCAGVPDHELLWDAPGPSEGWFAEPISLWEVLWPTVCGYTRPGITLGCCRTIWGQVCLTKTTLGCSVAVLVWVYPTRNCSVMVSDLWRSGMSVFPLLRWRPCRICRALEGWASLSPCSCTYFRDQPRGDPQLSVTGGMGFTFTGNLYSHSYAGSQPQENHQLPVLPHWNVEVSVCLSVHSQVWNNDPYKTL